MTENERRKAETYAKENGLKSQTALYYAAKRDAEGVPTILFELRKEFNRGGENRLKAKKGYLEILKGGK